uniref:DUF6598 domain-containing protein n=1 Tax=Oryza nivara TaxID=4536 RepID=A0A0E0I715_ORYNI
MVEKKSTRSPPASRSPPPPPSVSAGLGPPIDSLTYSVYPDLQTSVNIISIKVIKSDVGYPISVFGTVLARDQYDYRCVYLFRRGRDDPQIINSPVSISYYLTNGD